MQPTRIAFSSLAFVFLAASPSEAQEERYQLERTENGYVRMDTRTGAMTLCREQGSDLVCRPASEGNEQTKLDTLRDRIEALEGRVEALEGGETTVPLEEEFEQSLNMMERFFRRFIDIVRGLEEEEQPQETVPQEESAPAERT